MRLRWFFIALFGLFGPASSGFAAAPGTVRPNIVFLMADDQCTYSMGCYGTPRVKTPHLDQLVREGLVFDRHYDTTSICMGSRANVMTGMYEFKTGCNFDHGPLLQEHWNRSYPKLLREAGYMTAFAGKIGFEVATKPKQRGILPEDDFDMWGGSPGQTSYDTRKNRSMAHYADKYPHSTLSYGAFGRDFIHRAAQAKKPFSLSISFKAPHRPVQPDPRFDHIYRGQAFQKPANFGREHGTHFSLQSRQGRQYERFHSWNYSSDYDGVMAKYYQQIYAIDVAVGMIREALQDAGVEDNTVVIYTSDNGFMCGSHGYGSKVLPYEESSRVPLIVFDPRRKPSVKPVGEYRRTSALTGNIDFAPTMLALAGIEPPANMDGRNLMAAYDDPSVTIHESLQLINAWGPQPVHSLSIVTGDWKYIYWPYAEGRFQPTEELYHLEKDPLELNNLAKQGSAGSSLEKMRRRYDQAVQAWKTSAVPYHGYRPFGRFFARQ